MALYVPFGDDGAPASGTSTPSVWSPGLVIAAIAIVIAIGLSHSTKAARRRAREGKRWPPYEHVAKRSRAARS